MVNKGSVHIDIAEVRTAQGKRFPIVAIDRTSKFALARLVEQANRRMTREFLEHFHKVVRDRIHTT